MHVNNIKRQEKADHISQQTVFFLLSDVTGPNAPECPMRVCGPDLAGLEAGGLAVAGWAAEPAGPAGPAAAPGELPAPPCESRPRPSTAPAYSPTAAAHQRRFNIKYA